MATEDKLDRPAEAGHDFGKVIEGEDAVRRQRILVDADGNVAHLRVSDGWMLSKYGEEGAGARTSAAYTVKILLSRIFPRSMRVQELTCPETHLAVIGPVTRLETQLETLNLKLAWQEHPGTVYLGPRRLGGL